MTGQMCWLSPRGEDGEKLLYLRLNPNESWTIYTSMPKYSVPDYKDFPNGSKGFATFQKLLRNGWKLISSDGQQVTMSTNRYTQERLAS
jgi:hypothetical protein